jgi:transposase
MPMTPLLLGKSKPSSILCPYYKLSAVEYYLDSNASQLEVCDIFRCSPRSLLRWTHRYLETGSIVRHNRPAISYKIRQRHVDFILDQIKSNRMVTLNELKLVLKEEFPSLAMSLAHLHRIVRDNNISLKLRRVRHEPIKRYSKPVNIKEELKKFYDEVSMFNLDDIICLDETNIQIFHKRNFCYSPVGKRCVVTTQSQEVFKRYTTIFAISTQGVVGWRIYPKGGIDSHRLKSFLEQHVTGKFNNKLIIMDNASCHRNPEIKKLVQKDNKLLFSVPYQHFQRFS